MKVLMLNYEFPPIGGGASPVSYDIAKRLAERGHNIDVVTMGFDKLPFREKKDGIDIHRVKCIRSKSMVCHPWEQLSYILSAIVYINKNLCVKEYDLCFAHFIIPTAVISRYLKNKYNLRYIVTAHGSDVIGHNKKRFGLLYSIVKGPWKIIVKDADCIIAPSNHLMGLIQKTQPDSNCVCIPNGVDTAIFENKHIQKKQILVLGRLQETKNVETIIRAFSLINDNDWKLMICGDGPCMDNLKQLAKDTCQGKDIEFTGWIENKSEKHLRILQESAIYVSASLVENCPTSVLEAISCGANVLLSDIPAHRQLVRKVSGDIFFDPDSTEQLLNKLKRLIYTIDSTGQYYNNYDASVYCWEYSIDRYEEIMDNN